MKHQIILIAATLLTMSACSSLKWDSGTLLDNSGKEILKLSCASTDGILATYQVNCLDDGLFHVKWKFIARHDIDSARVCIDVSVPTGTDWWMMPAVSYNGNNWGTGSEPKGASDGENGWWSFSYRRSPIPGAIYSENRDHAVATWCGVPKCANEDFSYSIMPEENRTTHRYIWPEEEMPRAYTSRDIYSDGWQKRCGMKEGETHSWDMYISVNSTERDHRAVSHFMKSAWNMADKESFAIPDADSLWNYGIRFAKESLWDPTDECIGFRIGVTPYGGYLYEGLIGYGDSYPAEPGTERMWRKTQGYMGGWVGRNIYIGCAMLSDYLLNGNKESLDMGIATLDYWAENAPCESGLLRSTLPGGGIDACNMGAELLAFSDAYKLAAKCGIERPKYLKVLLDACNAAMVSQRNDGCYARSWTTDAEGKPLSMEGFTSTYLISPMLRAYEKTADERYLNSAKQAFRYYVGEFNRDGFTTAGALDTYCIDKESSMPLFVAAVELYDLLGESEYLDDALALGYYISSWLWCYDGIYPSGDSFTEKGFHTFGGTSVSTQHQCLDNFSLPAIPSLRRLSELTGDRQWAEKADAMYRFCCQLISDGNLEMNGRIRPVGGQSEAYFQAEWYLYGNKGRFDNWLVAWPGIMRLEYFMHEKAEQLGL